MTTPSLLHPLQQLHHHHHLHHQSTTSNTSNPTPSPPPTHHLLHHLHRRHHHLHRLPLHHHHLHHHLHRLHLHHHLERRSSYGVTTWIGSEPVSGPVRRGRKSGGVTDLDDLLLLNNSPNKCIPLRPLGGATNKKKSLSSTVHQLWGGTAACLKMHSERRVERGQTSQEADL